MSKPDPFIVGQCWISPMEPELGLGLILEVTPRQIEVGFPETSRRYSIESAPLRRLPLRPGDKISTLKASNIRIESVSEQEGLRTCHCGPLNVLEPQIVSVNSEHPEVEDELFHSQFDTPQAGQLRIESLYAKYHAERSVAKGWVGPRVQLIPHQLNTAWTVVEEMPGRFWLADEVGLGKTITAGLALHYLLQAERVERVLILVPDALLIQWFIELYRKFNLAFSLINDYFKDSAPSDEFWAGHDLCLSSYEFVASSEALQESLKTNKWDLLMMDEAHHLPSAPIYQTTYLSLIMATDSTLFLSASVDSLPIDMLGEKGRVFRSTRQQIPLFPKRQANLVEIPASGDLAAFHDEFNADAGLSPQPTKHDFLADPRIDWLLELLRELNNEKVLLIAHTAAKAQAIQSALRLKAGLNTALFHEGMTLVARDRMSAYFADNEDIRLMICSEIGSEGRNFQFCHHLVLFDYPLSIDLLEQRIGRIDRIGQTSTINLHMPFVAGSPQSYFVRWLNESVGLFDAPCRVGDIFLAEFRDRLISLTNNPDPNALTQLINEGRQRRDQIILAKPSIEKGAHREAPHLLQAIRRIDASPRLTAWIESTMDHFGVEVEDLAPQTCRFITDHSLLDALSGADDVRPPFTFSRATALRREDYHFLTWDHPLTQNALMLLMAGKDGVCSAAHWPDKSRTRPTLYVEAVFVAGTFPLRIMVDERGEIQRVPLTKLRQVLGEGSPEMFRRLVSTQKKLLHTLLKKASSRAEAILKTEIPPRLAAIRLIVRG